METWFYITHHIFALPQEVRVRNRQRERIKDNLYTTQLFLFPFKLVFIAVMLLDLANTLARGKKKQLQDNGIT